MQNDMLEKTIEEMRTLGEQLIEYNYPKVPAPEEDEINILKGREATVDGYELILHYSKSDYGTHYLESFQVLGKNMPFLPFHLVCKLAKRFLGEHYLSLVEIFRDNRKVYVWTITLDHDGKPLPYNYRDTEAEECTYDGFIYHYMNPRTVNFY